METKFARRLRRQRHIGSSCGFLELLAPSPRHARLLAPSGAAAAFGRAGASRAGAAATSLSMRVSSCRRGRSCCRPCASVLLPAVLRPSAAPAPPAPLTEAPLSAGFGRSAGGAPKSGFIGRRRRLCRAIPPNLNGRGLPSHEWCSKRILKPQK
jgi:hypothetical protein